MHGDEHRPGWIAGRLAAALREARAALDRTTAVLLGDEPEDGMKAAGHALHKLREGVEDLVPAPSGTTPPSHMHATVVEVHVGGDLERLAELTQQIADIAWSRQARASLLGHVRPAMKEMSDGVLALIERTGETVLLEHSTAMAAATELERELDAVAERQRTLDDVLVAADPPIDEASAVDLVLLGRCYEGCAQHAVSAARHLTTHTS